MLVRASLALALSTTLLAACGGDDPGPCDPSHDTCVLARTLSTTMIEPGQEISGLCQSWTLDNPEEIWVDSVTMRNGGGYHHSNWFFVPDTLYQQPDGSWDCNAVGFDELVAAVAGGFLFAQSTQVSDEDQTFKDGAAIRIPPYSRIIGSTHLLNVGDTTLASEMAISVHTLPPEDVRVKLVPSRATYFDLHLAAGRASTVSTTCELAQHYQAEIGMPLKERIHYVLPHYHALGTSTEIALVGGPRDGEVILHTSGFGEVSGKAFSPPIDVAAAGATGLRFSCSFMNPTNQEVQWGIGDQEMCEFALFVDSDMAFDGSVHQGDGLLVGTGANGEDLHEGPCDMFTLRWDHNNPGGLPN
ncbi:MAG: hypothetical protein IPL61_38030 [Myxococcales bacterium]|nr:hypothetical protein [Myxococcales bacterium]